MPVQTAIQTRRGTASSWTSTNPTLAAGEIGFETDTGKFKIGTGSTAWASLPYAAIDAGLLAAKGDLVTATANDTPAVLTVGSNGETLVADSSASTGLRWQGSAIGKNATINGGCEIAQRGTSAVTLTAANFLYPVDRFFAGRNSGTTGATAQQISSTGLDGFQYAVRIQRTAGNTATNDLYIGQSFETANSIPFANKTIVFSFWARAGANYSPTSSALNVRFYTGTGTDQAGLGSAFTGSATPISQTATLTTSWQRFQYTATISSTATQMQFLVFATPTGTAGAADYFDVTGFQVESGSVATPFSRSSGTLAGELTACGFYTRRITSAAGADSMFGVGYADSTVSSKWNNISFPPMRTAPSLTVLNNNKGAVFSATNSWGVGTLTLTSASQTNVTLAASGMSSFTSGQITWLGGNSGTTFDILLVSEL